MSRISNIISIFALVVCVVTAFKGVPVSRVATRAMTSVNMSPMDAVVEAPNMLNQFSQLLAAESDFGGYVGPAGSLIFIGVIILALAPPLASPDQD